MLAGSGAVYFFLEKVRKETIKPANAIANIRFSKVVICNTSSPYPNE